MPTVATDFTAATERARQRVERAEALAAKEDVHLGVTQRCLPCSASGEDTLRRELLRLIRLTCAPKKSSSMATSTSTLKLISGTSGSAASITSREGKLNGRIHSQVQHNHNLYPLPQLQLCRC